MQFTQDELDALLKRPAPLQFQGADLSKANLFHMDLHDADLSNANLGSANLSRAKLLNTDLYRANLCGADLANANLRGAKLFDANLCGANLSGAYLSSAKLRSASLINANLGGANLIHTDLRGANLRSTNLVNADLSGAKLINADLRGTKLRGANLTNTEYNVHTKWPDGFDPISAGAKIDGIVDQKSNSIPLTVKTGKEKRDEKKSNPVFHEVSIPKKTIGQQKPIQKAESKPVTSGPIAPVFQPVQVLAGDFREDNTVPQREEITLLRIVRDTKKSQKIKKLYQYTCQICGLRIQGVAGPYAEGAHIRPLGQPHNGPDSLDNLLCLCPNHHAMFDLGVFTINADLTLNGIEGKVFVIPAHKINLEHLKYHRELYKT